MSIREIVLVGNPNLKKPSTPIKDFNDPGFHGLIKDLLDTMKAHNGAGLAAPQIGALKRIIAYGFTSNPRYPKEKSIPETVLINPEILEFSEETEEYYEGCLSFYTLRGLVPRPRKIVYKAVLPSGKEICKEAWGFEARIIQHETDHLDGILFPNRMKDINDLTMFEELQKQGRV